MVDIITIDTPSLGDRSYIATDGDVAVVIDAQRDIDRVLEVVDERGLRITHVLETHIHNDYVTGGYALALQTGASYVVAAADDVSFERVPVRDGDVFTTGRLRIRAMHTPGHTFTHMSYVVEGPGAVPAVFSGGSLLFGSTGRPDLLGSSSTDELARLQHASARRLATELPGDAQLLPTHGFGSFCAASQSEASAATLLDEQRSNPALTLPVEEFVAATLAGLDDYPSYYAHMAPLNAAGPPAPDLSEPPQADAAELRRRVADGEWVVDLRSRAEFAAGHLPGSLSFDLDGSFITYLGWLIPWGTPVTLLGETRQQIAAAQRDMARIGMSRPVAAATGSAQVWLGGSAPAHLRRARFTNLRDAGDDLVVLDVRRNDEWRDAHIPGALHIPLHNLLARIDEVPDDRPVWVHCASGYRSSIAASILQRGGRAVVAVDDEFTAATGQTILLPREAAATGR